MASPMINTGVIYKTIVQTMPQEGRDFALATETLEGGNTRLVINPITPLGRAWVPFLQDALSAPMQTENVAIAVGGAAAVEIATVNRIREQVESEAMAALTARVAAAEADTQKKQKMAEEARKEQLASGDKSRPSEAVVAASNQANAAYRAALRAKRVLEKVQAIRDRVNKEATDAANADAKNGRVWAVDMDEELKSLFDRQDVRRKFQEKEELIRQIAEHEFAIDEIKNAAVNAAKQYIIQKEG